jgi:hypothetical protein
MNYEKWFTNLINTGDFITTDKYLNAQSKSGYRYVKRDYLYSFGKWRGKLQAPSFIRQLTNFKKLIVIGHSDIPVLDKDLRNLKRFGYKKIYGVNVLNRVGLSESIPLGVTNDCDDSQIHRLFGNIKHFERAHNFSKFSELFNGSIYLNFTLSNNFQERMKLVQTLRDKPNAYFEETKFTESGRINYLQSLRKYSLVPCPSGNGFDTHRLWETLYMGGTPVIRTCEYLPTILRYLPVIILSSWEEICDLAKLDEQWHIAQSKRTNWEYLTASYWLNHMSIVKNS